MILKYKLTDETIVFDGRILHRIEALKDFRNVRKGDKGGWVERKNNLSHLGNCWIYGDAKAYGDARVADEARVYDRAIIRDNAEVNANAYISSEAILSGDAIASDDAMIFGRAIITGKSIILGTTIVFDDAYITNSTIKCHSVSDKTVIMDSYVNGGIVISGEITIRNTPLYGSFGLKGVHVLNGPEDITIFRDPNNIKHNIYYSKGLWYVKSDCGYSFDELVNNDRTNESLYKKYLAFVS